MQQSSDRQTFVIVAQTTVSVAMKGLCLVVTTHFQVYTVFGYLLHNNVMFMSQTA